MSEEKRKPHTGYTFINRNGDIKEVITSLAFDRYQQKQIGYFPCDENGVAIEQPAEEELKNEPVKKNVAEVKSKDEIRDYSQADLLQQKAEIEQGNKKPEIVNPLKKSILRSPGHPPRARRISRNRKNPSERKKPDQTSTS